MWYNKKNTLLLFVMSDTNLAPSQGLSFYEQGMPSGMNDMFEAFLGPSPRPQATNPYEKRNISVFNMPDSYLGRNLFLKDTVEDWMFTGTCAPSQRMF